MPLPNVRVVVIGQAKADADFDVVEINAEVAKRLARELATDTARAKREIDALIRGAPAGRK